MQQGGGSVGGLSNFQQRLAKGTFPEGSNPAMQSLAGDSRVRMKESLDDDLNTAQAQAAVFDMVRAANAAMDSGELKKDDVPPLLAVLAQFDEIFSVLRDDDAAKMPPVLEWAKTEGRKKDITPQLLQTLSPPPCSL